MTNVPASSRNLSAYLTTATLSRSATESAGPALLVAAIAIIGNATTASYLVASLTASAAVAGPVVGAAIDRSRSARHGFATSIAVMGVGLVVVALTLGRVPTLVSAAFAVGAGLGYPALTGAWSAQLTRLVPTERITKAYAADAATYSIAAVVAPPAATALVALAPTAPLWLPIALLVIAGASLPFVPLPTRAVGAAAAGSLLRDLRAGTAALVGLPGLRRTAIITTVGFAGQSAVFVAAPLLALAATGSLGFTGVVLGAFALGGITTAAWFARHPVRRPDRMVILSTVLSGVFLLCVGLAPTSALLVVAAFAMGATEPPLVSSMFQVRVRESPANVQAQVFTTGSSLRMTAFAAATATCGWLLHWGVGAVIAFGVGLHALSLVLGLLAGPPLPPRTHWVRRP